MFKVLWAYFESKVGTAIPDDTLKVLGIILGIRNAIYFQSTLQVFNNIFSRELIQRRLIFGAKWYMIADLFLITCIRIGIVLVGASSFQFPIERPPTWFLSSSSVEEGSHIITEKWPSYQQLETHSDYIYSSVNHTQFCESRRSHCAHTHNVECLWHHAKKLRRQYGTSDVLFHSYLFEFMWRCRHPVKCFNDILITIRKCYNA